MKNKQIQRIYVPRHYCLLFSLRTLNFSLGTLLPVSSRVTLDMQGAHPSGKSQGNLFFLQGQEKVREFCKMVREIRKSSKVREKSGILKYCLVSSSKIEQTDMRW